MWNVRCAGVTGRPCQIPGTGIAGVSHAFATISTRPCRYSGMSSGPVSRARNVIAPTSGTVVSVYGPMFPGASGLTGRGRPRGAAAQRDGGV